MSNKKALVITILLALTLCFAGCGSDDATADTVIKGSIYTADGNDTIVSAAAIKDGKFVYVGDENGVDEYIGDDTEVIETEDGMAMPAFIDGHGHGVSGGLASLFEVSLYSDDTIEGYQKTIKTFINDNPDLEFIRGAGWINGYFPNGTPTAEMLDKVTTEIPIAVSSGDHHSYWVNSKTMELMGVDKNTKDVEGGVIERDSDGNPIGTFRENAQDLVAEIIPEYTVDEYKEGIKAYTEESNSYGVTGALEAIVQGNSLEAYNELDDAGELDFRIYGGYPIDKYEDLEKAVEARKNSEGGNFTVDTVKIFIDGVVEGRTGYLLEDYADEPGFRSEPFWTQEDLNKTFIEAEKQGLQIHVHAIVDGAINMTMDAFENARSEGEDQDLRHAITHLQLIDEGDIKRMADLNIVAATNPYWHYQEPGLFREIEIPYLGEERANRTYPMKSFFDAGVVVNVSTDYPVTVPPRPLDGIQIGATRMYLDADPDRIKNPDEAVSILQMLKAATYNGAYSYFEEELTGSIEEGKNADVIILDKNILEIDPTDVASSEVLKTFFRGNAVYEAEEL